jgi:tight adherence protein C
MLLFLVLAFLCGTLLALGLAALLQGSSAQRRLAARVGGAGAAPVRSTGERLEALLAPLAKRVGGVPDEIRQRLVQAGFRSESSLVIFAGGRVALPLVLAVGALLIVMATGGDGTRQGAAILLGAGAGYVGPSWYLDKRRKQRQAQIQDALPDALDLLVVCLEAGLSLGAAFARVAREFTRSSPALCEELRLVTLEMQAGKAGAEALRAFADRVGIQDVSALAAMLIQTERFGTSVADALRVHCEGMRKDRLQRAEEKAQKAAVKMIVPAAIFIFPATMLVLIGPAGMQMMKAFATVQQ